LTAAISSADTTMKAGLDVASLAQSLDAFHLMAYDFHGSWEASADHHAPLNKRSWDTTNFYSDYA
jgi:chitinase